MFDYLIVNGRIIDGTGRPPAFADVAIAGDRIAAIGQLFHAPARYRIDAAGKFVAPGFIDMHTHYDVALLVNPDAFNVVSQGVTTAVIGNCGHSPVPITDERRDELRQLLSVIEAGVEWRWQRFADYLTALEEVKPAINTVALVGHCALRAAVVGFKNRPATDDELKAMQRLLRECMDEGAFGLSSGLVYPPSAYAPVDELVELNKVVAERGGIYATHMRNESDALVAAVAEALQTALRSGVRLQISHHKAARKPNWGKVAVTLRMIEDAALRHDVSFDAYPYTAGSSYLAQLLPLWALEGGASAMLQRLRDPQTRAQIRQAMESDPALDFTAVRIASVASDDYKPLQGKTVAEIAELLQRTPAEAVLHLIEHEQNAVTMVWFVMDEADVAQVLTHPLCLVGSDALTIPSNPLTVDPQTLPKVHPRTYGTFPRVLRWLVRETGKLRWEDAIAKMTGKAADKLRLKERGLLREGYFADVVVFDPERIADRATYDEPHQPADGIEWVFVNGQPAIADGRPTGARSGCVLRFAGA
ncbi:D-aminoacylase [bacterium HR17]|uniref:D-aminoacylase n=1 Tax=Candidatus Fervidibacter japonicus TaxID=2035412 RepID=A0A2H5X9A9_9BACT|nr:D-aminoacylase [bacterium HR17]